LRVGGEFLAQGGDEFGLILGVVFGFLRVFDVVVEFDRGGGGRVAGLVPFDKAVGGGAQGAADETLAGDDVKDLLFHGGGGVLEDGDEAGSFELGGGGDGQAGEFDEGRVEVDGF